MSPVGKRLAFSLMYFRTCLGLYTLGEFLVNLASRILSAASDAQKSVDLLIVSTLDCK